MVVELYVYAAVVVPVSLLLGFCAATISFTAWNLMVPLLLSGLGLSLVETMFISVMLDLFNSIAFTFIYGSYGRVDWVYGLVFGFISAVFASIMSNLLLAFLEKHEQLLEGFAFFIPYILALGFLIKAEMTRRKKKREQVANNTSDLGSPVTSSLDVEMTAAGAQQQQQQQQQPEEKEKKEDMTLNTIANHILDQKERLGEAEKDGGDDRPSPVEGADDKDVVMEEPSATVVSAATDDALNSTTESTLVSAKDFQGPFIERLKKYRCMPPKRILAREASQKGKRTRIAIMAIFTVIMGILSGILYVGGGMAFALAIAIIWKLDIRYSTGTASFMMFVTMFILSFTFVGREGIGTFTMFLYLVLSVPFSIIGAIAGSALSMRVSSVVMYFLVTAVLFILGIALTIEYFLQV